MRYVIVSKNKVFCGFVGENEIAKFNSHLPNVKDMIIAYNGDVFVDQYWANATTLKRIISEVRNEQS